MENLKKILNALFHTFLIKFASDVLMQLFQRANSVDPDQIALFAHAILSNFVVQNFRTFAVSQRRLLSIVNQV